jgi:hypothetical protein
VLEREGAALEQVLEPSGGGDEDVCAARRADLLLEADAAVDGAHAEVAGGGQRLQLVDDLGGELARRSEHERGRARCVGRHTVDDRRAEGERLARARGRLGEHVAAGEHVGDDELLNGEGGVDPALGESARDRTGYAESGEGLLGHWRASCGIGPRTIREANKLTRTAIVAGPKQANCLAAGEVPTTARQSSGALTT